jgi:hypothetical protein
MVHMAHPSRHQGGSGVLSCLDENCDGSSVLGDEAGNAVPKHVRGDLARIIERVLSVARGARATVYGKPTSRGGLLGAAVQAAIARRLHADFPGLRKWGAHSSISAAQSGYRRGARNFAVRPVVVDSRRSELGQAA